MANGNEEDHFIAKWCQERHRKIDEENDKVWETIKMNDEKQTSRYTKLLYLMITNLGTLTAGLILLLIKFGFGG